MSIYVFLATQDRIFLFLRIVFCLSLVLHTISLRCLIKLTPPNQASIRKYLIYIQILLVLSDFHMGIFFEPIPLFPVLAGYSIGLLNRFGVPVQVQLGTSMLFNVNVGLAIVFCNIFRHQSILPNGHALKVNKKVGRLMHWVMLVGTSTPPLIY
ncbi:hypothetical protein PENTCL1PPCAC_4630, partial [Pristionchus entomophagus]